VREPPTAKKNPDGVSKGTRLGLQGGRKGTKGQEQSKKKTEKKKKRKSRGRTAPAGDMIQRWRSRQGRPVMEATQRRGKKVTNGVAAGRAGAVTATPGCGLNGGQSVRSREPTTAGGRSHEKRRDKIRKSKKQEARAHTLRKQLLTPPPRTNPPYRPISIKEKLKSRGRAHGKCKKKRGNNETFKRSHTGTSPTQTSIGGTPIPGSGTGGRKTQRSHVCAPRGAACQKNGPAC